MEPQQGGVAEPHHVLLDLLDLLDLLGLLDLDLLDLVGHHCDDPLHLFGLLDLDLLDLVGHHCDDPLHLLGVVEDVYVPFHPMLAVSLLLGHVVEKLLEGSHVDHHLDDWCPCRTRPGRVCL